MSTRFFGSIVFIFFLTPLLASADVVISEIMYDAPGSDSGREWIEIQNSGVDTEDVTSWKLFENGTHHKIVPVTSARIPAGAFAVIVDNQAAFLADYPTYTGLLFDSAFSLKNSGESLSLKNASSTVLFEAVYEARVAKGDGNSLNHIGGVFEARTPSPGGAPHASAILPKIKNIEGNSVASGVVQEDDAGYARAVSTTASASSFLNDSSGIIPWALALFGVIAIGSAALLFQGTPRGSGYRIIEEKQ